MKLARSHWVLVGTHVASLFLAGTLSYYGCVGAHGSLADVSAHRRMAWAAVSSGGSGAAEAAFVNYARRLAAVDVNQFSDEVDSNAMLAWALAAHFASASKRRQGYLVQARAHCEQLQWEPCSSEALERMAESAVAVVE